MAGRQPIIQHAAQPLSQIREWATKRVKHLMGFDEVEALVDHLMALQSAEETEKYIKVGGYTLCLPFLLLPRGEGLKAARQPLCLSHFPRI